MKKYRQNMKMKPYYNITIDMIKNIKRNLQNGKSVIYESELVQERYDYYLNLLKQFTEINV